MNEERREKEVSIVLAGNPNVGKSTVFNCLTGMRQHTGNWAGKTVASARGKWRVKDTTINLIDAPGCYSLQASSAEEEVARDCICDPVGRGVIIVCDGTCLERNLILALQILRHRDDVIICINLMDQVRKRGLAIDGKKLSKLLGVRVIMTESSKKKEMRKELEKAVLKLIDERKNHIVRARGYVAELLDTPEETAVKAEEIARQVVCREKEREDVSLRVDKILTSRFTGYPVMIGMLAVVFWLTITGANYPSQLLSEGLFWVQDRLTELFQYLHAPDWLHGALILGVYRVLAWVVSVMLPPMAIFFPLFTLLEDAGYLPRVAYNLDRPFHACRACGKQALTMCMGLGCNAAGVVGCRIIDSERERLLAVLTNSLMPCNGRFPALIALMTMFFAAASGSSLVSALLLTAALVLSVGLTFGATWLLSVTVLRGRPSAFALELPPYRAPQVGQVIVRSVLDRTLFVLGRAAAVAAPAGIILWTLANVHIGGASLLAWCANALDPLGRAMGMDGVLLLAFVLGFPANEIVLPIAVMGYLAQGSLDDSLGLAQMHALLTANGWTWTTAVSAVLFFLLHWPCSTTLWTIRRETGSAKWTLLAALLPTAMGMALCTAFAALARALGW